MRSMDQRSGPPPPRFTDEHVPHIHPGRMHVIPMVVTLMVTRDLGARLLEPVLWAGGQAGLFPGTISQPSPEFYKTGATTVPIPQMETLRLREETWARADN